MDRQEGEVLRRLGQRLTEIREKQELTIAELAARSGLDPRLIGQIEAGQVDFEVTVVFALAQGLGLSPRELLKSL
jgi:transcriptional regulator with XRE-family HTH domain